mmetsp:Transcript_41339/g.81646  ORF Transcript_41339/g.81646 Transcript_41339/m.81646 type:complete len:298 (+) Transcript_41339:91-984(+)
MVGVCNSEIFLKRLRCRHHHSSECLATNLSIGPGFPLFQPASCVDGCIVTISLPFTMDTSTLLSSAFLPSSARRKEYQPRFSCLNMRLHLDFSKNSRSRGSISSFLIRLEAGTAEDCKCLATCGSPLPPSLVRLLRLVASRRPAEPPPPVFLLIEMPPSRPLPSISSPAVLVPPGVCCSTRCCSNAAASARSRAALSFRISCANLSISERAISTSDDSLPSFSRDVFNSSCSRCRCSSWLRKAFRNASTSRWSASSGGPPVPIVLLSCQAFVLGAAAVPVVVCTRGCANAGNADVEP